MHRRTVLNALGASAVAAILRPLSAEADAVALPQRLLMIHRPCGTVPSSWWPTGGVRDWALSPILQPFAPLQNDMVVLKGVDCPRVHDWAGNQSIAGMLAMTTPPPADGWPVLPGTPPANSDSNAPNITAAGQSIDQLLLRNVRGLQGSAVPSLQLAASLQSVAPPPASSGSRAVSYAAAPGAPFSAPLTPALPSVALKQLTPLLGSQSPAQAQADQSVRDFVTADLDRLRRRLPVSQLAKLDGYLQGVPYLDSNTGPCEALSLVPLPVAQGFGQDEAQYEQVFEQQNLIIKTAFQCDLTRVISFTYAPALSQLDFSKIVSGVEPGGHYDLAQSSSPDALIAIETFYAQQTAWLLLALKNTPEGNGSVLDNTLVVYWNNESVGNGHGNTDMPVLLFGGRFLGLQGGSYLNFQGRFMSDLWVETAHAFGFTALQQYGAERWNKGPMPGIYG